MYFFDVAIQIMYFNKLDFVIKTKETSIKSGTSTKKVWHSLYSVVVIKGCQRGEQECEHFVHLLMYYILIKK